VPDSMGYEIHIALRIIQQEIGMSVNEYVAKRLGYENGELCSSLSAEQIDAVAMAIYNVEEKRQAVIIGDQTGIGKGRVAAAMIRYASYQGYTPLFFSEKPNLFTDIYRDLSDIGSSELVPFIVNGKASKTDIKDKNGDVVYSALPKVEQDKVFKKKKLPAKYNFVCLTYSQISSEKYFLKRDFISSISQNQLVIMDESHNASGTSNTGLFLQAILENSKGATFLSATFAKRPDNMPIYAKKTAISDASMTDEELVEAMKIGGVALQEVISAQLVSEGQMIRRERSFEGVEVNYITLENKAIEHKAIYDNITSVLRDIIVFQSEYIKEIIDELDGIAAAEGQEVETTKGTNKAGVDNPPYFSKVFQVVNQMLFSIKAESAADLAIQRMREGKKPVIAFASTMESFFDKMDANIGDTVDLSYAIVLEKGLQSVMKMTTSDAQGNRKVSYIKVNELPPEGVAMYDAIQEKIRSISNQIIISPIDLIKHKIEAAGFSVAEVTGRKTEVQIIDAATNAGVLLKRKRTLANDAFRMFNDNEVDCLMINQSGSTGASAHAIVTDKVPAEDVRQRVMIVLQPELNINTEVQKRGRINRTGQILKPIYDYLSSAIPAEQRLMMMLQKKLKSLDANTTSNQKQSEEIMKTDDFLNKYGDKIVTQYLAEDKELVQKLDNPLKFYDDNKPPKEIIENAASKVAGRVAVLPTIEQEKFYENILLRYNDYVAHLKQTGEYDLEIETFNFESETNERQITISGNENGSVFSENTYIEKCEVNNLKKPFTSKELQDVINDNLNGQTAETVQNELMEDVESFYQNRTMLDIDDSEKKYEKLIKNIESEPKFRKLKTEKERYSYKREREDELQAAKEDAQNLIEQRNGYIVKNIKQFLKFFYIGRVLYYPDEMETKSKAVCVGYNVNRNQKNPFIPSGIKVKIAISDSNKYLEFSLSGEQRDKLAAIMGYSQGIDSHVEQTLFDDWDYDCRKSSVNRKDVYIVTGNILQGFAKYSGKLISFTEKDGAVRKGILLPNNYDPVKGGNNKISVPIHKALDYIRNLRDGSTVISSDGKLHLSKEYSYQEHQDVYKLMVPSSNAYARYFKDEFIISRCTTPDDGFNKISSRMVANFLPEDIESLITYLGVNLRVSISISPSIYDNYFDDEDFIVKTKSSIQEQAERVYYEDKSDFERRKKAQVIVKKPKSDKAKRVRIAKVKAAAKLKLMKL